MGIECLYCFPFDSKEFLRVRITYNVTDEDQFYILCVCVFRKVMIAIVSVI